MSYDTDGATRVRSLYVCVGLGWIVCVGNLGRAETMFGIPPGASAEESAAASAGLELEGSDQARAIQAFDSVLARNPRNRAARLARSRALLTLGRVKDARSDLEFLRRLDRDFLVILPVEAECARVAGDRTAEVGALDAILTARPGDRLMAGDLQARRTSASVRLAELRGDAPRAESLLRARVLERPTVSWTHASLGEFLMRQGRWREAVKTYEAAKMGAEARVKQGEETWVLDEQCVSLAIALWSSSEREGAFREVAAVFDVKAGTDASGKASTVPGCLVEQALLAGGLGTEEQKEKAAKRLADLARVLPRERKWALSAVVLALGGVSPVDETATRVREVLKEAPHLDWALWAALYLGLCRPAEAKDMLELLPQGSVQRRIAEVEQAAARQRAAAGATSQPAGGR